MKRRLCIINANIISKNELLENRAVIINNDRIERIIHMPLLSDLQNNDTDMEILEGDHAYLASGFIDVHSDNIETVIQPRPTSVIDFNIALMEQEKQLVNQGITTMYHSLSLIKKGNATRNKSIRNPDQMILLADVISKQTDSLIRHRFHCRFDIRNLSGYDVLMDYLEKDYVHLLSYNDHTPGQGQYRDLDRYRINQKNYNSELNDQEIENQLQEKMAQPTLSSDMIKKTADLAQCKNIPIASHDDDSVEKIDYVNSVLKATISEFPVELEVAKKAKEKGMYTIAGAPNVLMGKSHSGNMSAIEGIMNNCIDILCSDYYPPAMLHAVYKLYKEYGLPLWKAFNLITLNPAKALGIDRDFGSVEQGKKADLLMIKIIDGKPAITKVLVDGRVVSALYYN